MREQSQFNVLKNKYFIFRLAALSMYFVWQIAQHPWRTQVVLKLDNIFLILNRVRTKAKEYIYTYIK